MCRNDPVFKEKAPGWSPLQAACHPRPSADLGSHSSHPSAGYGTHRSCPHRIYRQPPEEPELLMEGSIRRPPEGQERTDPVQIMEDTVIGGPLRC